MLNIVYENISQSHIDYWITVTGVMQLMSVSITFNVCVERRAAHLVSDIFDWNVHVVDIIRRPGWQTVKGVGVNQAYSRLSTTRGHITDCKLDSVGYAGVCVVIVMWTCLVWAERSPPDNF